MRYILIPLLFALTACEVFEQMEQPAPQTDQATDTPGAASAPPPRNAQTVEQFDTTTDAQREAAATPSDGGTSLGETVGSLGDPALPGFWIETPLIDAPGTGRIVNVENGNSVEVELRPIDSGSARVSLAALRLLDASLTDLVTLDVYQN